MEKAMEDLQKKLAKVKAQSDVKSEIKKIQMEMDYYKEMSNLTIKKSKVLSYLLSALRDTIEKADEFDCDFCDCGQTLAQFKTDFVRAKEIYVEENSSLSFKEMINNMQLHEKYIVGLFKGFDTGGFEEDILALE